MIKIKKPFTLITNGFDVGLEETVKYDFVVSKETWTVLKEFETASVVVGYPEGYDDSNLDYFPEKWTLEDIKDQFSIWDEDDKEEFDEHEENYEWFGEIFEWVD